MLRGFFPPVEFIESGCEVVVDIWVMVIASQSTFESCDSKVDLASLHQHTAETCTGFDEILVELDGVVESFAGRVDFADPQK